MIQEDLGQVLSAEEVAKYLGLDVKTVRQYYLELGGMRLGRKYLFFERRMINAIQERTEMDSPSAERGEEKGEGVSNKETGFDMGRKNEAKTRQRVEREDRHGLFG